MQRRCGSSSVDMETRYTSQSGSDAGAIRNVAMMPMHAHSASAGVFILRNLSADPSSPDIWQGLSEIRTKFRQRQRQKAKQAAVQNLVRCKVCLRVERAGAVFRQRWVHCRRRSRKFLTQNRDNVIPPGVLAHSGSLTGKRRRYACKTT